MPRSQQQDHREAIERLLFEYANAVDDANFARVGELFKDGTLFDNKGSVLAKGAREVADFYTRLIKLYTSKQIPLTQHVVSNLLVTFDDENLTAHSQASFTVYQQQEDQNIRVIIAGRYIDRFERTKQGWKFREHRMFPSLVGDLSQHIHLDQIKS